jgi:hypothetical protein
MVYDTGYRFSQHHRCVAFRSSEDLFASPVLICDLPLLGNLFTKKWRLSNLKYKAKNEQLLTQSQTSNRKLQTSNSKPQTSNFKLQT